MKTHPPSATLPGRTSGPRMAPPQNRRRTAGLLLALATLGIGPATIAANPQPSGAAWDWNRQPPQIEWRAEVGAGFAALAPDQDLVIAFGNESDEDRVTALDAASGKVRWTYRYPARALGLAKPDEKGPRATPLVHGGRVFTLSRDGRMLCLDRQDGRLIWWHDVPAEWGERPPYWGFSGTPLVQGDRLIWNIGAGGIAVRANDGVAVWRSPSRPSEVWKNEPVGVSGYITPARVEFQGQALVALASETRWLLVDPETGAEKWSTAWETPYGVNAAQPAVADGGVALAGGYGYGARWIRLGGDGTPTWTNLNLRSHFAPLVIRRGHLFGIDGNQQDGSKCELRCLNPVTGAIVWSRPQFGFANLLPVGDLLLVLTARGELVAVPADPAGYREAGRVQVLGGESWTAPVLAGQAVYVRNKQGLAAKVRLPAAP